MENGILMDSYCEILKRLKINRFEYAIQRFAKLVTSLRAARMRTPPSFPKLFF